MSSLSVLPPALVYHGTGASFEEFAHNERGLFFAERYNLAASFARIRETDTPRVIAAVLDIVKPWTTITYGDDVPYRDQIDQSPAAIMARGYDGIHLPAARVWIALRPNQVTVIDPDVTSEGFVADLLSALDESPGAAHHFAHSGAWGMALALFESIGGMLVVPGGGQSPFVRTSSGTFDWRGQADHFGGYRVSRDDLVSEAIRAGLGHTQLEEDRVRASHVIDRAREMSLLASAEHAPCDFDSATPQG